MLKRTVDGPEGGLRRRTWFPWPDSGWQPPPGYVPYLLRLPALQGRHYGEKVVIVKEYRLPQCCYFPCLVGRVAGEGHSDWKRVGDHEVLVHFGLRGIVRFPRDHLRLVQD